MDDATSKAANYAQLPNKSRCLRAMFPGRAVNPGEGNLLHPVPPREVFPQDIAGVPSYTHFYCPLELTDFAAGLQGQKEKRGGNPLK
ncbi:hypothetical protein PoB_004613500 [Plakobranchus ocellatus]|uniref:Uncharacterized protein n=1 Tax=Plakobranchus ocellatus TaxID=259542 RepID=A0AAV4BGF4_9GAST|nr:hypothetical protein PoB_004613500 [Plakobranchus ocellatus]